MSIDPNMIAKAIGDGSWQPNIYLTNVSVAQFQKPDDYVAYKLFPIVPVRLPMGKFYKFNKGDLARPNMDEKPAFGTVAPSVFSHEEDSYSVKVYQSLIGIDQISALPYQRAGAPGVIDPKVAKAKVAAEQTKLFMDMMFADKYFKSGAWEQEYTGVGTTPSGSQFYQFDNANSDPIKFVDDLKTEMKREGRRMPNKLALGAETYIALKNNPAIIERIKYSGSSANPAMVNQNVLAQLFGVEEVLVLESTYNTAKLGQETDMKYVCDPKGMLLCYTTKAPAIDEPSAGYIFTWDMLGTGQHMAVTNFMGAPATHSEFVEALCSFDMKKVSQDLAVYCGSCVS
jgi:hypothetical protein